jgi:hypothetical protein
MMKLEDWFGQVNKCMENKVEIEASPDIGSNGVFYELLERFCTDKHRAIQREELLLGKPWHDEGTARYYFRLRDLMDFLDRMKFKDMSRPQISNRLKKLSGESEFMVLNGRGTNLWYVPDDKFQVQLAAHEIKQIQEIPI